MIATQWISTWWTAQALTWRYLGYDYYTKTWDNEYESFSLTTPLYAYTEIYASGVDAYEVKFYSWDDIIYTWYVSWDNQSKLIMPSDPVKDGYDFAWWKADYQARAIKAAWYNCAVAALQWWW